MKKMYFLGLIISFLHVHTTYSQQSPSKSEAVISRVRPLIEKKSKLWGNMVREKDVSYIETIYDKNATYLPNSDHTIYGQEAIEKYWKASLDFLGNIELHMKTLDGTKEILYETGLVSVDLMNQKGEFEEVQYKYANVWKLQEDGSYKVVIDIFNDLRRE